MAEENKEVLKSSRVLDKDPKNGCCAKKYGIFNETSERIKGERPLKNQFLCIPKKVSKIKYKQEL